MAHILVVDDKEAVRSSFVSILRREGHRVVAAGNVDEALQALRTKPAIDLILTDLRMPESEEGLKMVEAARSLPRRPAVIVVTGYGTIASAVEAMRLGADDYVTKPLRRQELLGKVDQCLRQLGLLADAANPPGALGFREILAESASMRQVLEDARRLAPTEDPILISGPIGTGRSILARAIHVHSPRARAPFLIVHGSRLQAEKLERAAALGQDAPGVPVKPPPPLFAPAAGGTVYLSEIEQASPEAQTALVRLLREAPPVIPIDSRTPAGVRLIASTAVNLEEQARAGVFRSDLYYLVSRGLLSIPALKDRPEDITPLAKHFLKRLAGRGRPALKLSRDARRLLLTHDWPGNVRELETVMERAATLADGDNLDPALLQRLGLREERALPDGEIFKGHVADAEREAIQKIVSRHPRDLAGAARQLGISRTTLWRKMKKYGMIERSRSDALLADEQAPDEAPPPIERPYQADSPATPGHDPTAGEEQAMEGGA